MSFKNYLLFLFCISTCTGYVFSYFLQESSKYNSKATLQNWDKDIKEIMQRKMKIYQEKRANIQTNSRSHKETHQNTPITLTDFNFNEAVHKYPLLIVDFWADWCGPCRMVSPTINQLSIELADKATFGKINVDYNTN